MSVAKLMYGQRSAFHLVPYTWGNQEYSRLLRGLELTMLLPWLDLIIETVGAFQFLTELLYVTNLRIQFWRYAEDTAFGLLFMTETVYPGSKICKMFDTT